MKTKKIKISAKDIFYKAAYYNGATYRPSKSELEILSKNPEYSLPYAVKVMQKRWPEAESCALDLLKKKEFSSNSIISTNLIDYCVEVVKGRWSELEDKIIKYELAELAVQYSGEVVKGRWQKAEKIIFKDIDQTVSYASSIGDRLEEEAEESIKKDPVQATQYAINVIKKRWPEAEPYILKDLSSSFYYFRELVKAPWSELEPLIISNIHLCMDYVDVTKKRWVDLEKRLVRLQSPQKIIRYFCAVGKVGEELHNKMVLLSFAEKYKNRVSQYFNIIESKKKKHKQFLSRIEKWITKYKGKTVDEVLGAISNEEYKWIE